MVSFELEILYADYLNCGLLTINEFRTQTIQYFTNRIYDSSLGDDMPLAIANTLSLRIYIIDNLNPIHVSTCIEPRNKSNNSQFVILHYKADH